MFRWLVDAAMDLAKRHELARKLLDGYVSGPAASTQATARALMKAEDATTIVFVEGVSDQIALETVAARLGYDLAADGTVVFPIGGAHALVRFARQFGPLGDGVRLAGLCDVGEEEVYRRGLIEAHVGSPSTRDEMEQLGFHVCVEDLEDEFIRAIGASQIERLFKSQGDLRSFRSLQAQPAWRGREVEAQMRRFFGSGARRKLRYGRLLAKSIDLDRLPYPLQGVLARL
jgi:hypothetical protein